MMTPCPECGTMTRCRLKPLYLIAGILFLPLVWGLVFLALDRQGRCPRCGAEVTEEGKII